MNGTPEPNRLAARPSRRFSLIISLSVIVAIIAWALTPFAIAHWFGWPDGPGTFGDSFGAVTALFTALAFAGLLYTAALQREELATTTRAFLADHERRRLESTLSALTSVRPSLKTFSVFLDSITGPRQNIKSEHVNRLRDEASLRSTLHGGLEEIESLALALNIQLYDDGLAYRLTGPFLTNLWARCELYINDFRQEWPTVCVEFEQLVERYRDRAKHQYEGSLRHAPVQ
jgi:hypothetical protein